MSYFEAADGVTISKKHNDKSILQQRGTLAKSHEQKKLRKVVDSKVVALKKQY